jgi:hypothetical protein
MKSQSCNEKSKDNMAISLLISNRDTQQKNSYDSYIQAFLSIHNFKPQNKAKKTNYQGFK